MIEDDLTYQIFHFTINAVDSIVQYEQLFELSDGSKKVDSSVQYSSRRNIVYNVCFYFYIRH